MRISIVIPNYNGLQLLQKNLAQVVKRSDGAEIIIVDDGSTDDSVKYIKQNYPQIKIIQKLLNDGFATTVNLGAKAVSNDIFLLLNTDTIPKTGFLAPLIKHFADSRVFAVGCLERSPEKGKYIQRGRGIGRFHQGFLQHQKGEVNKTTTLWVSGGSGVFRKSIWEQLGGMDEIYNPFYWEDIDLSYRAAKSGYQLVFEPNSHIEHWHQEGAIKSNYTPSFVKSITYRNQFIFTWKNITDVDLLISHMLWLPAHMVKAVVSGDWLFLKGLAMAILKLGKVFKIKSWQNKMFVKSDQDILRIFADEV